jgi:hypothetical protein
VVVVGCPQDDNNGKSNNGAAFVYQESGGAWNLETTLYSPRPANSDQFGAAVATDGKEIVIGAPLDNLRGSDAGAAFGWADVGGVWTSSGELVPTDNVASDQFGSQVDIDSTLALVGSTANDLRGSSAGMVWSFRSHFGAFYLDQLHAATTTSASDYFGTVAVQGNRAVIGATGDDVTATNGGEAYIFSVKEFVLSASPDVVSEGQQLDFVSYCGMPSTPCYFGVLSINGIPFFQILFKLNFASDHRMQFSTTVPSGLSGLTVAFETFKIGPWNKIMGSTVASVQFN